MEASEAEMCASSLDSQQEGLELLEDSPFGDIPGSDDLWEDEIEISSVSLLLCYPWRDPNLNVYSIGMIQKIVMHRYNVRFGVLERIW
jgi:hypothetical protein